MNTAAASPTLRTGAPRAHGLGRSVAPWLTALVLMGALSAGSPPALAHGPESTASAPASDTARAESLTAVLTGIAAQLGAASVGNRKSLEQQLLSAATTRRQLLVALLASDPGAVLRLAVPPSTRASMPTAVKAQLEEEVQLEGALEIFHQDTPGGARFLYGLHVAGKRYALHFSEEEPSHLTTGARVRVKGVRLDTSLALAGGGNTVQTLTAAPVLSPIGEQRTLVMLVNFSDNATQPWTRDEVRQEILGTMSDFMRENSYGVTWVTGDVTEWMTIALSSSVCDTSTLDAQAQQAAKAAGWVLSNYARWMFAFPRNACDFAGAAFIGGSPSRAWLNGTIAIRTTAHEFGHGLGLWHSHSMDCGSVPLGAVCTTSEYGDTLDLLGSAVSAHYNAFQKERLGWLTPFVVTESGTHTLNGYESGPPPLAFKVLKGTDSATGQRTWFYLERRRPVGFDSTLTYPGMTTGVAIRLGSENNGDSSYMLDMTPNSRANDRLDPALVEGQMFRDPDTGIEITTDSITADGAVVTVRLPAGTAAPDPPSTFSTVTVATDQGTYSRNQQVSISTSVKSGTSPVAGAAVTLTITDAAGGVTSANATTGPDGIAVYKLRLRKQNPVGTYKVGAAVKKDTLSGTGVTSFTVR